MAEEYITLTIDDQEVTASRGATVLDAARGAGIYIPTLCHHPNLEAYGGCRMCIVEIEKMRGLPTSCTTPAVQDMVVRTKTPQLEELRRGVLEMVYTEHPHSCLVCWKKERCRNFEVCQRTPSVTMHCVYCPKNGRCELQEVSDYVNMERRPMPLTYHYRNVPVHNEDPFIVRDLNLCILCGRCVRVCQDVRVNGCLAFTYRGSQAVVGTAFDRPYKESGSEFCGACLDICPVGAIMERDFNYQGVPDKRVNTTCPYCGVGCQLILEVKGNRVMRSIPNPEGAANKGQACVKGRFGIAEVVHHPQRLTTPLVRREGELVPASWDEALDEVARGLSRFKPEEIAVFGAGKCTNEDNYVIQKLARAVLGTNNVDHCARLCHAPTVTGLVESFGSGAMTNSIDDIAQAEAFFVIGSNTTFAHPVIGIKVKQAFRQGKKLIVANPREIELARYADIFLQHRPGSDVALMMGMMRVIVDEGLQDRQFIQERCENYQALVDSLREFDPARVEGLTGVKWELIAQAARLYATHKPATILYAMGITQSTHGHDNVRATANLAMLTGNMGQPGGGVNPLQGHNNVQGGCDMGALPDYLPGYQRVVDAESRQKFAEAWGVELPSWPGLTVGEIIEEAGAGRIRAMYIMGENFARSEPCVNKCEDALGRLPFLVVQDMFLTETAQLATVVLPSCSFAEKEGTYTNTERRVQRVRQAVPCHGESRPDWWIACQVARRLGGKGFDYEHPSQIMDEIASLVPTYAGISYARLEETGGLQWPCTSPDHPGTAILHTGKFTRGRGHFAPLTYRAPDEEADGGYPLILTTERSLFQFHTGTMTRKVKGLGELRGNEWVEMNPQDAGKLGIGSGDLVRVASRRGEVEAKALVTEVCPPGVISMTFHFTESATSIVTNPARDPVSKIPELKVCAVKVDKVK